MERVGAEPSLAPNGEALGSLEREGSKWVVRASSAARVKRTLDRIEAVVGERPREVSRAMTAPWKDEPDVVRTKAEADETLVPGAPNRPGTRGTEAGDFDTLSFGAREQMGVISRLAYADLLKEAGRPTLIILDDALVHSDERRLAQMKRVLFDAAQRHQVLLFTSHPAHWRDMGVALRDLTAERPSSRPD